MQNSTLFNRLFKLGRKGRKRTGTSRPLSIIRLAGGRIILFRAKLSFVPSLEFLQYSA